MTVNWCKHCGTQFEVSRWKGQPKKFCSDSCRKRHWEINNVWRYQDTCPDCGGVKTKKSKRCKYCAPANNPHGYNGR